MVRLELLHIAVGVGLSLGVLAPCQELGTPQDQVRAATIRCDDPQPVRALDVSAFAPGGLNLPPLGQPLFNDVNDGDHDCCSDIPCCAYCTTLQFRATVERESQHKDLLSIYRGKLAEQFVAQELLVWGGPDLSRGSDLFYWAREARGSNAEVDFLIVREGAIYPVEVKSGGGGSLRSLHLMLEKYPHCPQGLILYSGVYKQLPDQKLVFFPLYSVPALCEKRFGIATGAS